MESSRACSYRKSTAPRSSGSLPWWKNCRTQGMVIFSGSLFREVESSSSWHFLGTGKMHLPLDNLLQPTKISIWNLCSAGGGDKTKRKKQTKTKQLFLTHFYFSLNTQTSLKKKKKQTSMLWAKNTNSYEFHSYLTWCGLSWGGCGVGRGMVVSIPLYARYMRKSKKKCFPSQRK